MYKTRNKKQRPNKNKNWSQNTTNAEKQEGKQHSSNKFRANKPKSAKRKDQSFTSDRNEKNQPESSSKQFKATRFKTKQNSSRRRKPAKSIEKTPNWSMYVNEGGTQLESRSFNPTNQFADFFLDQELTKRIKDKGYLAPTEIQDKSIPIILDGDNLIGVAGTGTGKTAAFLIPIIQALIEEKKDRYALIIAPTRELANQINDEFRSLVKGMDIFSTCLIGGSSVFESIKSLKRINHLVIGTPGRLMDMHRQGHLPFDDFKILVLDEFDRMLDMGFKEEMKAINSMMEDKEQTLLFSATVDTSQKKIIKEIAGDAVTVKAATDTQKTDAIHQDVLHVKGQDKFQLMHNLIAEQPEDKVILFCETKRKAEKMLKKLKDNKVMADAIHGDKSQKAREIALRKFKRGQVNVLVATDVVARGIDVSDVSLVINYEAPRNYTDYVHRIGRTGRAGKTGRAITMID
jgi:ATP-dependent RNA helicase RhlE